MDKQHCLNQAVEITKEYARGGGTSPDAILKNVYEMLKELDKDANEA